jgi:hypothetical protein
MNWPMPLAPTNCSDMPVAVNRLADRIASLLPDEVRAAEREVLRSAFMTLAHRLQPEPLAHRCKRIREAR